ncbi:zinc finger protein 234-like [Drosophila santomea]|uniref:zinc finger protein 234-like n=1 Tax=Drosophila santomea TaxID=129105 RepID=UPI0019541FBD|nr:zinc finger protein 234-like [Drosophila santomea]
MNMGRKCRKTKQTNPLFQNTIKREPDPGDSNKLKIMNAEHINDRFPISVKAEDTTDLSYPQTGLYEVVMLEANNQVKEEFALEDQDEDERNPKIEEEISYQLAGPPKLCSICWKAFPSEGFSKHVCMGINAAQEKDEISYHLAGPPKMCSKCLEAFPIEEFSSHTCRDIHADRFSCKICPRKFRYKSLLVVHLKSHLRLQKGESIPELESAKPTTSKNERNFELNYSPTPRWKISRRRAGMLKRNEMRVHQQRLCLYCPIAFSNESHLEKHIKDHHAERFYSSELITPDFGTEGSEQICVKLEDEETI